MSFEEDVTLLCRGCGWGFATGDGFCLNCVPAEFDDGDEFDDDDDSCDLCGSFGCDGECEDGDL